MVIKQETIDRIKVANEVKPILEVGDKVICIEGTKCTGNLPNLEYGKIYTILRFNGDEIVLSEIDDGYSWLRKRFRKVDEILVLMQKIGYETEAIA